MYRETSPSTHDFTMNRCEAMSENHSDVINSWILGFELNDCPNMRITRLKVIRGICTHHSTQAYPRSQISLLGLKQWSPLTLRIIRLEVIRGVCTHHSTKAYPRSQMSLLGLKQWSPMTLRIIRLEVIRGVCTHHLNQSYPRLQMSLLNLKHWSPLTLRIISLMSSDVMSRNHDNAWSNNHLTLSIISLTKSARFEVPKNGTSSDRI